MSGSPRRSIPPPPLPAHASVAPPPPPPPAINEDELEAPVLPKVEENNIEVIKEESFPIAITSVPKSASNSGGSLPELDNEEILSIAPISEEVKLKIQDLENRIEIEKKVKEGAEHMLASLKDAVVRQQCESNVYDSQRRLDFLYSELNKLQGKHTDDYTSTLEASNANLDIQEGISELDEVKDGLANRSNTLSKRAVASFVGKLGFGRTKTVSSMRQASTTSISSLSSIAAPDTAQTRIAQTPFDFWRKDTAITNDKISFKLKEVSQKLEIEQKVKAGSEKMRQVVSVQSVEAAPSAVDEKLAESNAKVSILTQAKTRYHGLDIYGDKNSAPSSPEPSPEIIDSIPDSKSIEGRKLLSGDLHVRFIAASGIPNRKSNKSELYGTVKVDGVNKAQTKPHRNKWNEDFSIPVNKAQEVEVGVYEKGGSLLSLLWFKLSDLEDAITLSKKQSFFSKSNTVMGHSSTLKGKSKNTSGLASRSSTFKGFASFSERSHSRANESTNSISTISQPETTTVFSDGFECWLELEPSGYILLRLGFIPSSNKIKKGAGDGLHRRRAVQKIFPKQGHKLAQKQFYQVMKCAVCNDFLMSGKGYQCQLCVFTCHQKCQNKIMYKCIAKDSSLPEKEDPTVEKFSNYRIPHRFEPASGMTAAWCCHCGYMLPFGKKASLKCKECGATCHKECKHLVPDFCGLSSDMLEQIRNAITLAEKTKKEKEELGKNIVQNGEQNLSASALPIATKTPRSASIAPVVASHGIGLEDFNFLAVLGKGNFGKVMLVEERQTKNLYAIKVLKKEFIMENDEIESTRAEKRVFLIANKERHPFLVNLHSSFQSESRIYFVMEYVSGGDLMYHIQQQQFDEPRAKLYACEVLLALEYFHKNNIVYRDLKLDNILLTLDGHVKIADYGLCKENMSYGVTTNTFCGTPEFMAPEILMDKPYNRAVDWWAFGVLIYEMLLGQSPFKGDDEEEIFEAIMDDDIIFPASLSKNAVNLLQKLLCKDPHKRLGGSKSDAEEIKKHPYFADVDFDKILNREIKPSYAPKVTSPTDVSNFDDEFTKEIPVLTPCNSILAPSDQEEFRGFTYVSEWAQSSRHAALMQSQ